jgi:hypothetical protein
MVTVASTFPISLFFFFHIPTHHPHSAPRKPTEAQQNNHDESPSAASTLKKHNHLSLSKPSFP